jgi:hypothetical protein
MYARMPTWSRSLLRLIFVAVEHDCGMRRLLQPSRNPGPATHPGRRRPQGTQGQYPRVHSLHLFSTSEKASTPPPTWSRVPPPRGLGTPNRGQGCKGKWVQHPWAATLLRVSQVSGRSESSCSVTTQTISDDKSSPNVYNSVSQTRERRSHQNFFCSHLLIYVFSCNSNMK